MAERNFANRTLYHGDNLNFLRGMNSGTVDLIATDPPFNKSKDFHATPDSLAAGASFQDRWSWHDDIHDDWLTAIMRDEPEVWAVIDTAKKVYGDDMGAFLCWLGVRLLEMHRILADDGSIYLHIDHTAHAYVKALMDAVFGRENFRNEIVWCYTGPQAARRHYPRKHDIILFYSYPNATFNRDDIRIPSKWNELGGFSRPDVERQNQGKVPEDWWHMTFGPNTPERTGYPTQKPLALYERIIKASSDRGDLVLDPFCGCATTPVAAERLGRQWVGMDIWDGAHQQVLDRLEKEKLAVKGRPSRAREKVTPPPPLRYSRSAISPIPRRRQSARTAGSLLRSCFALLQGGCSGIPRRAPSTASCLPILVRSVRDAVPTTPSTRGCSKSTISTPVHRTARMPTRTSRCYARLATRRSETATRLSDCRTITRRWAT